jgi:hypothetical protein
MGWSFKEIKTKVAGIGWLVSLLLQGFWLTAFSRYFSRRMEKIANVF